jgi:hypothetical protein
MTKSASCCRAFILASFVELSLRAMVINPSIFVCAANSERRCFSARDTRTVTSICSIFACNAAIVASRASGFIVGTTGETDVFTVAAADVSGEADSFPSCKGDMRRRLKRAAALCA